MSHADIRYSESPADATTAPVRTERGFAHDRADQGRLLASALSWNMLFSAANGIVLLAGSAVLNSWLGVSAWLLGATGAGLLLFAGSLLWLLSGTRHLQWGARAAIAADLGWVAAASVVLLAFPDVLSPAGRLVLVALTSVVVVVAAAQLIGLRRAGPGPVTGVAPLTLTIERILAAPRNASGPRSPTPVTTRASLPGSRAPRSCQGTAAGWSESAPTSMAASGPRLAPCGRKASGTG